VKRARTGHVGALAIAIATAAASCGGGQTHGQAFDPGWADDDGAAAATLQRSLAAVRIPLGVAVAVGVVDDDTLVGAPLAGGERWTVTHALDDRPAVAGSVVVGLGGGELFALDAATGAPLWRRNAGGRLRGAGDDGETTVVSLASTTGRGSVVLAIARDGSVIRQIEDPAEIGVPSVIDGYALLPWRGRYVSFYDLRDGEERARLRLERQTTRAFASGGALFVGEEGLTRLDARIGHTPYGGETRVTLPARALPGAPRWMHSGLRTPPRAATAADKVHLYARPAPGGGIEGDRYIAAYYRVVVGLDARAGALAWVAMRDAEVLGADAYAGGFAVCDASGKVTLLDARSGAVAGEIALGEPLEACVVQADGLTRAPKSETPQLVSSLAAALRLPGDELVALQRVLLDELAKIDGIASTSALIDLASSDGAAAAIVLDARDRLAARRTGADAMLAALAQRYDFLNGVVRPPPVGPLSDALAAMRERRAAPLLAAHLSELADSPDDVRRAAMALAVLATPAEREPLRAFFAAYRCTPAPEGGAEIEDAVAASALALVRIGGAGIVSAALADPFTRESLRLRLSAALATRPN
jgi:outer membrane protein assembly factor BamB